MTIMPTIERIWEMPHRYTFKMKTVQRLLSRVMTDARWVDPFCGMHSPAVLRNDADEAISDAMHLDGLDYLKSHSLESVDGVLFDPPYSTEQALRIYKARYKGTAGREEYHAKCKDEIARIIRVGGLAVCFGWNSTGIGEKRGFALEHLLLICHGAAHYDTIVTVERKLPLLSFGVAECTIHAEQGQAELSI